MTDIPIFLNTASVADLKKAIFKNLRSPWVAALAFTVLLASCTSVQEAPEREVGVLQGRALFAAAIPGDVRDRAGWAADMYAAFAALGIPVDANNACAAVAIVAQESSFQADPVVPGLPAIARKEIERRREAAGIPSLVVEGALALPSTNGKTYRERLESVRTERQLSELFEDFIGRVPFGKRLFAERNPVRTGGPMQVSVAFAEAFAATRPYPYPVAESIRHEVFTRRGGVYFGIAHLLSYPAPYSRPLYRFADFNAGQYASRNAAFQQAVTHASGIPLELDGDLLRYQNGRPAEQPGATELALRTVASRLDMSTSAIRRDLEHEKEPEFEKSRLYERLYSLAQRSAGKPLPRAVMPKIALKSPKITRNLTSEWFAGRVEQRHLACLQRIQGSGSFTP